MTLDEMKDLSWFSFCLMAVLVLNLLIYASIIVMAVKILRYMGVL